ncbi:hypothetical protein CEXT_665381 [Caerostris extrusa]|uniref:Uncharacterized protein n=1 Tax=Caerostris extrusa TaxID=172846 RepID=A0AAV4XNU8_CAEEX|nr:hypothetical protein CEXT_665381 [Caerostris extrusa]
MMSKDLETPPLCVISNNAAANGTRNAVTYASPVNQITRTQSSNGERFLGNNMDICSFIGAGDPRNGNNTYLPAEYSANKRNELLTKERRSHPLEANEPNRNLGASFVKNSGSSTTDQFVSISQSDNLNVNSCLERAIHVENSDRDKVTSTQKCGRRRKISKRNIRRFGAEEIASTGDGNLQIVEETRSTSGSYCFNNGEASREINEFSGMPINAETFQANSSVMEVVRRICDESNHPNLQKNCSREINEFSGRPINAETFQANSSVMEVVRRICDESNHPNLQKNCSERNYHVVPSSSSSAKESQGIKMKISSKRKQKASSKPKATVLKKLELTKTCIMILYFKDLNDLQRRSSNIAPQSHQPIEDGNGFAESAKNDEVVIVYSKVNKTDEPAITNGRIDFADLGVNLNEEGVVKEAHSSFQMCILEMRGFESAGFFISPLGKHSFECENFWISCEAIRSKVAKQIIQFSESGEKNVKILCEMLSDESSCFFIVGLRWRLRIPKTNSADVPSTSEAEKKDLSTNVSSSCRYSEREIKKELIEQEISKSQSMRAGEVSLPAVQTCEDRENVSSTGERAGDNEREDCIIVNELVSSCRVTNKDKTSTGNSSGKRHSHNNSEIAENVSIYESNQRPSSTFALLSFTNNFCADVSNSCPPFNSGVDSANVYAVKKSKPETLKGSSAQYFLQPFGQSFQQDPSANLSAGGNTQNIAYCVDNNGRLSQYISNPSPETSNSHANHYETSNYYDTLSPSSPATQPLNLTPEFCQTRMNADQRTVSAPYLTSHSVEGSRHTQRQPMEVQERCVSALQRDADRHNRSFNPRLPPTSQERDPSRRERQNFFCNRFADQDVDRSFLQTSGGC